MWWKLRAIRSPSSGHDVGPEHWLTEKEILSYYDEKLGRAILAVRDSVGSQKKIVEKRWRGARFWMFGVAAGVLVISTVATVFSALTADQIDPYVKVFRVILPATIGLLAASESLF